MVSWEWRSDLFSPVWPQKANYIVESKTFMPGPPPLSFVTGLTCYAVRGRLQGGCVPQVGLQRANDIVHSKQFLRAPPPRVVLSQLLVFAVRRRPRETSSRIFDRRALKAL